MFFYENVECIMNFENELEIKLFLLDSEGKRFMGIGIVWLLRAVIEHKSLKQAAESMNLSYSKANKMVRRVESVTGEKLLFASKGGIERGGSTLTPFALKYIETYEKMSKSIKENSQKYLQEFQNEMRKYSNKICK